MKVGREGGVQVLKTEFSQKDGHTNISFTITTLESSYWELRENLADAQARLAKPVNSIKEWFKFVIDVYQEVTPIHKFQHV